MIIDRSKTNRTTKFDDEIEDGRSSTLRDGERRRFSMMMDGDPTGLTPVQKQALSDGVNKGVPFDRALETARSTTAPSNVRLHQPGFHGDAAPQAVADAAASYDKRNERLSNAWRDSRLDVVIDRAPVIPKPTQSASVTRADADSALDRRNARLANAYKS